MTIRPVENSFPLRIDGWPDRHKNRHDGADSPFSQFGEHD
jgi:hypothetical protein